MPGAIPIDQRFEQAVSPAFVISATGCVVEANAAARLELNASQEIFAGKPLTALIEHPFPADVSASAAVVLREKRGSLFESSFGGRRWLCHIAPHKVGADDEVTEVTLLCHDVSAIYEQNQKRILAQQELTKTLTKEVHHRIKNNLQGVVGLLRLHMNEASDYKETMLSAISQLLSIAAVYGIEARLDEDRIYFCSIVSEVARSVQSIYPNMRIKGPASERVASLMEGYAVPIALVINEMILNAAKHSPSGQGGLIRLAINTGDKFIELDVINFHSTLPKGFDLESGDGLGSGLRLVRSLLSSGIADLSMRQDHDAVVAKLRLAHPDVVRIEAPR